MQEVAAFVDHVILPSEFLIRLGEILPENIIIETMVVGVTKTEPLRELVWESRKDPDHERQEIHDGAEDPHIARG